MLPGDGLALAETVLARCEALGWMLATAESLTGGLLTACLAAHPRAGRVLVAGYVTYAPDAKVRDLAVPVDVIERDGVVSPAAACAMADGAMRRAGAHVAVAVTGFADGGESGDLDAGRVIVAVARRGAEPVAEEHRFHGGRQAVQARAAEAALALAARVVDVAPEPDPAP